VRISVCIPAYNEAEVIADTVQEAADVLAGIPGEHEILVVDDGSSDATWAILEATAERQPLLRPLRHERNRGNPAALKTLVEAARGDVVFHIGADRESKMSELPRMLEVLEAGNDIVIGVRRDKQYTPWRKFVSGVYNWLVALLWGRHFGDLGSIKLARASLWKRIPFDTSSVFMNAERILIAHRSGARIATVRVDHVGRATGKSSYGGPGQALRAFWGLLRFRFSRRSRTRVPLDAPHAEAR